MHYGRAVETACQTVIQGRKARARIMRYELTDRDAERGLSQKTVQNLGDRCQSARDITPASMPPSQMFVSGI
jgi:hypothetical protein